MIIFRHDQMLPHTWFTSSSHKHCNQDPLFVSSVAAGDDDDVDGGGVGDADADGDYYGDQDIDGDGDSYDDNCSNNIATTIITSIIIHSPLTASPSPRCSTHFWPYQSILHLL